MRSDPRFAKTPILALTAHALESERLQALAEGFDQVISKPCLPDELVSIIEERLRDLPAPTSGDGSGTRVPDGATSSTRIESVRLQGVLEHVRTGARQLIGADGVTFVLRDGDQSAYLEEDAIGPLWKGRRVPMRHCISGWVMTHAKPVVIPDVFSDPRIPIDAYSPTFVRSMAMAPVGTENPIGAVGAYWAVSGYRPTGSQLNTLRALADAAALALVDSPA